MSFELKREEHVGAGIRRIARTQLEKALAEMSGTQGNMPESVHDARVALKKLRGVLRLVRSELGPALYERQNTRFRDAGRELTRWRDIHMRPKVLQELLEKTGDESARERLTPVRDALLRELEGWDSNAREAMTRATALVEPGLAECTYWPISGSFRALAKNVRQTYRRARRASHHAVEVPTARNLHECRKAVKYFMYQVEILEPIWPKHLHGYVKDLDQLQTLLGDDHDLVALHTYLLEDPERFGGRSTVEAVSELIARRQEAIQRNALALARSLFNETPQTFVRRLKAHWKGWSKAKKNNGRWRRPYEVHQVHRISWVHPVHQAHQAHQAHQVHQEHPVSHDYPGSHAHPAYDRTRSWQICL